MKKILLTITCILLSFTFLGLPSFAATKNTQTKVTTMTCSVFSAPIARDEYRIKKIEKGYPVDVYPDVYRSALLDGKTFYRTKKGAYILCKCLDGEKSYTFSTYEDIWSMLSNSNSDTTLINPYFGISPSDSKLEIAKKVTNYFSDKMDLFYDEQKILNGSMTNNISSIINDLNGLMSSILYYYGIDSSLVTIQNAVRSSSILKIVIDGNAYYSYMPYAWRDGDKTYVFTTYETMITCPVFLGHDMKSQIDYLL